MIRSLSLALFADQELLYLLFLSALAAIVLIFLARKGLFDAVMERLHRNKGEEVETEVPSGYQKSRRPGRWNGCDGLAVTLITVLYAIVSLWQLGSFSFPVTRWQPASDDEFFVLEITGESTAFDQVLLISTEGDNNALDSGYQIGLDGIEISGSNDGENWEWIGEIEDSSYGQYKILHGSWNYRYVAFTVRNERAVINEIGLKGAGLDEVLPVRVKWTSNSDNPYDPQLTIDEQQKLAVDVTYMDETYFDEIYHVRNAQEIAEGQFMYASVHPLLGTQIIAAMIRLLGNHPFAWRIGGALFGIAMLPLMYYACKLLFEKTEYAVAGTLLLACDFMHLTTSRIATLEPFSVFFILLMTVFMLRYTQLSFYDTPLNKTLKWLFLSGVAMGLGIAVKWTGVYAAVGLAVLFFISLGRRWQEYRRARRQPQPNEFEKRVVAIFPQAALKTLLWCCLFFVVLPLIIYFAAYLPCHIFRDEGWSVAGVIRQTLSMYDYHAHLQATHPFQSTWWQWILDIRPIWYYHQVQDGIVLTISAFGNPLIWWTGFLSVIGCAGLAISRRNRTALQIVIAYLAQLVPWMLVSRCVFIYHYYPSVPFLILALVMMMKTLVDWKPAMKKRIAVFLAACVVVFVLFLPATAGFGTTQAYIDGVLRWFGSWYFG